MDLTVKDAAQLLGQNEATIHRWISDGTLRGHRINDTYRLNRVELMEWAAARGIKVSSELFAATDEPAARPLTDALRLGGVLRDIAGADKGTVLRAVCDRMQLPEGVSREDLYSVLMAREALASTAIGHGIAIPHPRSPLILGVKRPQVTLALPAHPVPFGALDGESVDVLFIIIATTIRGHLQMLSHLMFALQDESIRAMLKRRAGDADILSAIQAVEGRMVAKEAKA